MIEEERQDDAPEEVQPDAEPAAPEAEAPAEAAAPEADVPAPEASESQPPEVPEPPPEADATGAAEDAPEGELAGEEEVPAPPVRAREPEPGAEPPAPGVAGPAEAAAGTAPPRAETPAVDAAIPGADLEPDIVPEGFDPLGAAAAEEDALAPVEAPVATDVEAEAEAEPGEEAPVPEAVPRAAIDLAAGATYVATGKRKTAVARVILRPGDGSYTINGKPLNEFFPRATLQRNIRQPLETVGYESRMDVVARMHGGGVSSQAGALRHGIARALIDADPNLRSELKRRGFLTRDARVKERRKAGLKKARKRPQFSKR